MKMEVECRKNGGCEEKVKRFPDAVGLFVLLG
jgi:hypothetical protein